MNGFGGGGVSGGPLSPGGYRLAGFNELGACDIMADIHSQLSELSLTDSDTNQSNRYRSSKKPPAPYLCHLCFQKGHFIKDCPQVMHVVCVLF